MDCNSPQFSSTPPFWKPRTVGVDTHAILQNSSQMTGVDPPPTFDISSPFFFAVSASLSLRWDRWYIITQLAIYTTSIPLIHCHLGDYISPIKGTAETAVQDHSLSLRILEFLDIDPWFQTHTIHKTVQYLYIYRLEQPWTRNSTTEINPSPFPELFQALQLNIRLTWPLLKSHQTGLDRVRHLQVVYLPTWMLDFYGKHMVNDMVNIP